MSELELKLTVTMAMAVLSLAVSLSVAFRNWNYNEANVRFNSRNHYMNVIYDIDRQLIARPELWAIYDDHFMAPDRARDPEAVARRQAFIYYHLNLFESVFNDYNKVLRKNWRYKSLRMTETDNQYWQSWDTWIHHFFSTSSEALAEFSRISSDHIFNEDFLKYANGVIEDLKTDKIAQKSP